MVEVNDIYTDQYGIDAAPAETMRRYGFAMLAIAGADGQVIES